MPDVRSLIETAQRRGLTLFLEEGRVKVKAPQSLDPETQAFLQELREYKGEIQSILAEDNPILSPPEDREGAKRMAEDSSPPCWNCGGVTTETRDIYGKAWWACWSCAKWA